MTIKFDNSFIIPCPLNGFSLIRVINCLSCEFYQGLAQATQNDIPIEDQYQVICAKPITRRIQRIEE